MIFRELKENDLIYAYIDNKLVKTFKFKEWISFDNKRAENRAIIIDDKGTVNILTIGNVNQSICTIGNKKISTKELKC